MIRSPMHPWVKIILIPPIALYVVYVVGIAIFFNTPLFRMAAKMTDDHKTYISLDGAWSLVPGTIRAATIHVNVRESDVELDITLNHAKVTFDYFPLFHKRAHFPLLHVEETTVAIRRKTPPPQTFEPVTIPEERERKTAIEEQRKLRERWTIKVFKVELPHLTNVTYEGSDLHGEIAIFGSFMIQPGTQCEIYPSRLIVEDGAWNDEISQIHMNALVQFHLFRKSWLTGSEVLRYLDAHVEGNAKAKGLRFLNVTLRSLSEYGFGPGVANLETSVDVRAGKILGGSHLRANRSLIQLRGPRFVVDGRGQLEWLADRGADTSRLHVEIRDAETSVHLGKNQLTGRVHRVIGNAKLLGLDLQSVFSGLSARLRVEGGHLESAPLLEKALPNQLAYRVKARIGGELAAVAGEYPDTSGLRKPSTFAVQLDESVIRIPKFGEIRGDGRVSFEVKTIDFRYGRAELPAFRIAYRGSINEKYPFSLGWISRDASRIFGLKNSDGDHWRGKAELKIGEFGGILDYLQATGRISGIVRAGLSATEIHSRITWDVTAAGSRLDVQELDSNGIWSGFGTLISKKTPNGAPSETTGYLEGKAFGFPVHIKIGDAEPAKGNIRQ